MQALVNRIVCLFCVFNEQFYYADVLNIHVLSHSVHCFNTFVIYLWDAITIQSLVVCNTIMWIGPIFKKMSYSNSLNGELVNLWSVFTIVFNFLCISNGIKVVDLFSSFFIDAINCLILIILQAYFQYSWKWVEDESRESYITQSTFLNMHDP